MLAPTAQGLIRSATAYQPSALNLGWNSVVQQSSYNTCGPAAIATLLQHAGSPSTEGAVVREARMGAAGVTLAEFSRLANHFGLSGQWVRARSSGQLQQLPTPSVAHFDDFSGHFVVVLGDVDEFILLADPARGLLLVPRDDFLQRWSNRLFVLDPPADA